MLQDGGGGVLSVGSLPRVDTDPQALMAAAETMESAGSALRRRAEDAETTWTGLPAVYSASGTDPLYQALGPAAAHADAVGGAMERAGRALADFAVQIATLRIDREELVGRITAARGDYLGSEDGSAERLMAAGQLSQLELDVAIFAGAVELAEQTCVDALESIRGGTEQGVAATTPVTSYTTLLSTSVSDTLREQLTALAAMTPEQAERWLADHPELVAALAEHPPAAADVVVWWGSLGAPAVGPDGTLDPNALQAVLIAAMPSAIGNLNGVPYWARSDANVIALDRELAAVEDELDEAYQAIQDLGPGVTPNLPPAGSAEAWARWQEVAERRRALLAVAQSIGGQDAYDTAAYQLVELRLDAQPPFAAVASGNLDDADYVSVLAPGMNSTVESSLPGLVGNADSLLAAQQAQLGDQGRAAVLSWVGYETPDEISVFGSEHAIAGAPAFEHTLAGLDATLTDGGPSGAGPSTTAILHSYGGTMGSWALSQADHGVDTVVFLNSPGVIISSADQMHVDNVYAATPPDDLVVDAGNLPIDVFGVTQEHPYLPRDPEFGATWYEVPDTPDGNIGAHHLHHHFLDGEGHGYGSGSEQPGQALQQLVDITLGVGLDDPTTAQDEGIELTDPEQWQDAHDSYYPEFTVPRY